MAISISNNNPTISYTVASGQSQTQFTVPFAFFDDVDLDVFVNGTLQTITTHYTVAGGDGSTGTITFASAVSGPATVVINRDTIIQRSSDFPISGPFNISSLNDDLDRQILIQAELDKGVERSIRIPAGETTTTVLPAAAERADQFLVFDSNGNITTSSEVVLTTLTVDNINLDGNTISTVNTDGNLILDPNGAGVTSITGAATVSDTITSFGFRSGSANTAYNLFAAGGPTVANYIQSSGSSHILEIRKGSQTAGAGDAVARFDSVGDVIFYGDGRTLRWSGANNYLQFADDTKAMFGGGQDLQIWHDSIKQASFISDNGPHQKIYIESGTVSLRKPGGTELMAEFAADGAVKLYYDNVETLTTSATGVSIVGNIDISGTVDGRDIATDGTKLDNIEAGADVTDTDNVVAALTAGSNITIAADGTISSTASVEGNAYTAGTGLTLTNNEFSVTNPFTDADELKLDNIEANADVTDTTNVVAALTAGTNVTIAADGTISATNTDTTYTAGTGLTLTGTQFSVTNPFTDADELKLDNIEDGATADQTAAEILTAIKTVDGTTSGLDADLLDGQEGSYYLNTSTQFGGDVSGTYNNITVTNNSHTHDDRYYTETQADDRFVNVTGDTMSGNLTIDQGNSGDAILTLRSNVANTQTGDHPSIRFKQDADAVDWRFGIGKTDTDGSAANSQRLIFTSVDGNADTESLAFSPDNGTTVYTIFNDGYHPNADTWTTARTLSLSGDVTGSVSLDGSADVSMSVTLSSTALDSQYVNVTGDTMTGTLTLDANSSGIILKSTNSSYTNNGVSDDQFFVRHNFRDVEIGSTQGDTNIVHGAGSLVNIVRDNGDLAASFTGAGTARLYYGGDLKLATVSLGIEVTGEEIVLKSGAGTTSDPKFVFINEDTTITNSDKFGSIQFESSSTNTDASGVVAFIDALSTSTIGNSALAFGTFNNIIAPVQDDNVEERMRITAEGRVGIGTTAPTALLDVDGVARIRNGLELAGGGLFTGNVTFGDNSKAIFGAGNDLQIYHDGFNSYIDDAGAGSLLIRGTNLQLRSYSTNENFLTGTENGAVSLYYDGLVKAATTATGVDVTGTVTADGLTIQGTNGNFEVTTTGNSVNMTRAGNNFITASDAVGDLFLGAGGTSFLKIDNGGDISFYEDTGTTPKLFWDASAEQLNLGGPTSANAPLNLESDANNKAISIEENGAGTETWQIGVDLDGNLHFYDSNSATPSITFEDGGNVGIGTSSPEAIFHVEGDQFVLTNSGVATNGIHVASATAAADGTYGGAISFDTGGLAASGIAAVNDGPADTDSNGLAFFTHESGTGAADAIERLRITSAGNVGIGTGSPARELDVAGNIKVGTGSASGAFIFLQDDDSLVSGFYVGQNSAEVANVWNSENTAMLFATNNTERLRIDSAGNVGIGTSSPDRQLELSLPTTTTTLGKKGGIQFKANSSTVGNGGEITWQAGVGDTERWCAISGHITDNNATGAKGDLIFAVKPNSSDTTLTEALRIKSSGNVGIGESSPDQLLHLSGANATGNTNPITLRFTDTDTASAVNQIVGRIEFEGRDNDNPGVGSFIQGVAENTSGNQYLAFGTGTAGSASEKARIDASGNLLVGTTDTTPFDNSANSSADNGIALRSDGILAVAAYKSTANSGNVVTANRTGTDGPIIGLQKSGSTVGSIGTINGDLFIGTGNTALRFTDGAADIRPVNSSGTNLDATTDLGASATRFKDLYLSGGVVFGATGGSVTSKTLDDYEEGTFTPTFIGSTGGTVTLASAFDKYAYTKVGRMVTITGRVDVSGTPSLTGNLIFQGLPFSSADLTDSAAYTVQYGFITIGSSNTGNPVVIELTENVTEATIRLEDWTSPVGVLTNNSRIQMSITYFTA